MKISLVVCVVVALGIQGVAGQDKPRTADPAGSLHEALGKSAPQVRNLLTIINITATSVPKNTVGTLFAPNDAAVAAFLKAMGLTAKDLQAEPELVDLIVAYHFVPGYQITGSEVTKSNKVAATGDDNYILRLSRSSTGKLTVEDVQGNKATVLSGPVKAGKVNVFVVDKVLLSGNYFSDTLSALKHYPSWITTSGFIQQAGISQALVSQTGGYTLFVPSVRAWKPVEPQVLTMSNAGIADLLRYHVVPGARQVPRDFKNGTLQTLLSGHTVTVATDPKRMELNPYSRKVELQPLVQLTPEVGKTAEVQTYNIFAGRNILHGIDRVLTPDMTKTSPAATATQKVTTESAGGQTAAKAPAGASSTAPKAAAGSKAAVAANGRRLQSADRMLQPIKSLEIGTTQTDAAAVSVSKTLEAFTAAASGVMPVQYRSRFGSFGLKDEADGCLNCVEWAKGK